MGTSIRRFLGGGAYRGVCRAALLLLCFVACAPLASGQNTYFRYLRWIDNSTDPGGGFIVHVQNHDGFTEDIRYPLGDAWLSNTLSYYGTFIPVDEGESCFSVSRYIPGGVESSPSRTWCWYHDEPELTNCQLADMTRDGVVGAADWGIFSTNFGKTCD